MSEDGDSYISTSICSQYINSHRSQTKPKLSYDTEKDFAPITMVAAAAILMAVNPRVPGDTMRGFIEAAKARPQTIANYGSAGTGTVFHLTGELFKQLSGLALQHVPYRGGGPTVTALIAGEIPLAFETMLALQPHVRAGTLRALAITSPQRSAIMPEIPTTAEAGFAPMVADNSYALFAPAGTPAPDPGAAARRHARGAQVTGRPRPATRARRRGGRQQPDRAGRLCRSRESRNGPRWHGRPAQSPIERRRRDMSDVIIRDKAEYHARTSEQMERHLAVRPGRSARRLRSLAGFSPPRATSPRSRARSPRAASAPAPTGC